MKLNEVLTEFLKNSLKNDWMYYLKWVQFVFAFIAEDSYEDDIFKIENKKLYYHNGSDWVLLKDNYNDPIMNMDDIVTIDNNWINSFGTVMSNKSIETTVGRLVMNAILVKDPFKDKIDFINEEFNNKSLEKKYIHGKFKDGEITVEEFTRYLDLVMYIEGFANTLSLSATEKAITPPPGKEAFKKKMIEGIVKEYGKDALKNPTIMAKLEKALSEFDDEYLKGDEANGRLISGKVKNMARKKLFLTFGIGNSFKHEAEPVIDSLDKGIGKDPEKLAILFNDARAGSFSRGAETQQGGVIAKETLRATSDVKILDKDCGNKIYIPILVTKENRVDLVDRYIFDKKLLLLTKENIDSYIGKVVNMRSPLYCKLENHLCKYCTGVMLGKYENGVSILATTFGGTVLKESLSKFHGSNLEIVKITKNILS